MSALTNHNLCEMELISDVIVKPSSCEGKYLKTFIIALYVIINVNKSCE